MNILRSVWNPLRGLTRSIHKKVWASSLVLPLVAVLPTLIISLLRYESVTTSEAFSWFFKSIEERPLLILFFHFWPIAPIIVLYFSRIVYDQEKAEGMLSEVAVSLLRQFDRVVGKKLVRLNKNLNRGAFSGPAEFLENFIDPESQIEELMQQVYVLFSEEISEVAELEVGLALIKNGRFLHFEYYLPDSRTPGSAPNVLRKKHSCVSRCIERRKICIVEKISAESKKKPGSSNFAGSNSSTNHGSIICYPVFHHTDEDVPYVISIKSSVENDFTPAFHKLGAV